MNAVLSFAEYELDDAEAEEEEDGKLFESFSLAICLPSILFAPPAKGLKAAFCAANSSTDASLAFCSILATSTGAAFCEFFAAASFSYCA